MTGSLYELLQFKAETIANKNKQHDIYIIIYLHK